MAMLEINHLQKKFGTTEVLRDVSLSVSKGDVVAILGPSGSGKTTLLRCVNFLERADAGELLFDDEKFDLNRASHRDIARIRQKTAFVFQNYNLFRNKTALQNVTEGLIVARKMKKADAEAIGRKLLDKVGLSDRCDHYPAQLSGGQQQRVAIARALATNPEIIYFDEPPSMNTTRFDTCRAKFISCVTTSIVMPSSANWRITLSTSPINSGSSADVGSSK